MEYFTRYTEIATTTVNPVINRPTDSHRRTRDVVKRLANGR
jgi:hypothetical protein